MIRNVVIKNFQSHKETTLGFDPGVNVIIGPSDCGKTAILRALLWVATNRPSGEAFRSTWGGETAVTIELGDGTCVERRKDKRENTYSINGEVFRAFGQDVPEEVAHRMNLDAVNIQRQLDAPYLLSDTPGEVARQLNAVARLDDIDRAAARVAAMNKRALTEMHHEIERANDLTERVENLSWLDEANHELLGLEGLDETLEAAEREQAGLATLARDIEACTIQVKRYADVGPAEQAWSDASEAVREFERHSARVRDLFDLLKHVQQTKDLLKRAPKTDRAETLMETVRNQTRELEDRWKSERVLRSLLEKISTVEEQVHQWGALAEEAQDTFDENMPDVCPLCGQGVKK